LKTFNFKVRQFYEVLQIPVYLLILFLTLPTLSWSWILISVLFAYLIMIFGQEIGGHRYFSHNSFELSSMWEKVIFSTMVISANGSPLDWRSSHLDHHQYSDTELDPTSPKKFGLLGIYSNYWKLVYAPQTTAIKSLIWVNKNRVHWISLHQRYFFYVVFYQLTILFISLLFGIQYFLTFVVMPVLFSNIFLNSISVFCHKKYFRSKDQKHNAVNNTYINLLSPGAGMHKDHHNIPGIYKNSSIDLTGTIIKLICNNTQKV